MFRSSLLSVGVVLATVLASFSTLCVAQSSYPNMGRANFGVQLPGGPIDSLDPATGNISIVIPVRSKLGMSYNLAFTSGIYGGGNIQWSSVTQGTVNDPANSSDFQGLGHPSFLDFGYSELPAYTTTETCNSDTHDLVAADWTIYDNIGTPHSLGYSTDQDGCITPPDKPVTTGDGSGLTVGNWNGIYDKFGNVSTPGSLNGTFDMVTPSGVTVSSTWNAPSDTNYVNDLKERKL